MKSATVQELKEELSELKPKELVNLCLRLARFKKENKELLTYLLYEAGDEAGFIRSVQIEVDELFEQINQSHLYFAKKSLRKIVRIISKYCRYSGQKATEVDLRIYFCQKLHDSGIPVVPNPVIRNLYKGQLKKVRTLLKALHEDIQHDYERQLEKLERAY